MAAPNILGTSPTCNGKTAVVELTTSAQDIIATVATGHVVKVNSLRAVNIDGTSSASVTARIVRSATNYPIASTLPVNPNDVQPLLDGGEYFYLEEGDKLTALASANGDIQLIASYEDIS